MAQELGGTGDATLRAAAAEGALGALLQSRAALAEAAEEETMEEGAGEEEEEEEEEEGEVRCLSQRSFERLVVCHTP